MWSTTKEFGHPINLTIKPRISRPSLRTTEGSVQMPSVDSDCTALIPRSPNREEPSALAASADDLLFEELAECHREMCMKRAFLILHNTNDAEDAVQSAFRKAFQHRHQFQGNGAFAAWLGRIVENECLMRIRKQRNARLVSLDSLNESNVRVELVSTSTNPEDELGWKEVVTLLGKEIVRMPPLYRNVILLHDHERLPMPAVAERLGLTVPAAKSRLLRARRELRSRFGKHCGRKGAGTLLEKAVYSRTAYASGG
jgi:RNA polymerase sigma-70 factor (ECF subfamily)